MHHGFKIFDSDTHLNPSAETLEPYFDGAMRQRLPEWESCKVPFRVGWAGEILEPPYRHRYQFRKRAGWREKLRILGEAGPREHVDVSFPKVHGQPLSDARRVRSRRRSAHSGYGRGGSGRPAHASWSTAGYG